MTNDEEYATIPGYVSIKEAAHLLGISTPRMYGYVREKRIPALKAGKSLMIPIKEVEQFTLHPPGRARRKAPLWRVYNTRSKLLGTSIQVQVRPGQQERLLEKLTLIHEKQYYTFPGTMQRYIFKDNDALTSVSIWLVWKDTEMPEGVTQEQHIAAFQAEFADILDWETAQISTKEGLLYT